jgi:hypothetical protein
MNSNEREQAERRQVLRDSSTFLDHARAAADDAAGGRFAKHTPSTVVGTSPSAVPKMPEGNPWQQDRVPDEAPLGFSVNDMPVVGEPHEIAQSLQALAMPEDPPAPATVEASTAERGVGGISSAERGPSIPKPTLRRL